MEIYLLSAAIALIGQLLVSVFEPKDTKVGLFNIAVNSVAWPVVLPVGVVVLLFIGGDKLFNRGGK